MVGFGSCGWPGLVVAGVSLGALGWRHRVVVNELPTKVTQATDTQRDDHDHSALLAQLDALKSADPRLDVRRVDQGRAAVTDRGRSRGPDRRPPLPTQPTAHHRAQRAPPQNGVDHRRRHRVQSPKLWAGSFFPSLLEPRRRIDKALHAVIMEAYVHGVSTRSVDDLVAAMGVTSGSPNRRSLAFALAWIVRSTLFAPVA